MRKKIIIPIILVLGFSLAACGKDTNENTTEQIGTIDVESTETNTENLSSELGEINTQTPDIDLGDYEIPEITVDDSVIDSQLDYYLSESANRTIADGDSINVSYTITVGDNSTSYENIDIIIGEESIAPGIDEELKGQVAGYSSVLSIAAPDGTMTTIDITINSVSPQLTNSYIQNLTNGEYKTVDEFKQYLKESNEYSSKIEASITLIDNLKNNIQLTMDNETMVSDEIRKLTEEYSSYGETMNDVAISFGFEDENSFNSYIREQAEDAVKEKLVYEQLASDMVISVSEEDIENYKKELTQYYTTEEINNMYSYDDIKYFVLQEKVFDALFN